MVLFILTASSLGQLVRPNMGMSSVLTQGQVARVRQVPTPPLPLAQLGTAPQQLSATLAMRMSAPGSGQRQQPHVITNEQISLLTFVLLSFSQRTDDPGGWARPSDVVRLPDLLPWFSQWRCQKGFAQQYESWFQFFFLTAQPPKCLHLYCCLCVVTI